MEKFQSDLSEILDYVKKLDEVNTEGLEPTYQVTGLKNVMRSDKIFDYGVSEEQLLMNAPNTHDHQFKVKRVL